MKNAAHRRHAKMVRAMRQREIDIQNEIRSKEISRQILDHIEENHRIRMADWLGCFTGAALMLGVWAYSSWK